jgi:protein-tyrosine-phosphatase
LWICTANACRSQIAQAILRHVGGERFESRSAGACPTGWIHPLAEEGLTPLGISLGDQYSKGCDEMLPLEHDIIITLCDAAACVIPKSWKGDPVRVHWSLPDPVSLLSSDKDRAAAAATVARWLHEAITEMIGLPLETMDRETARKTLAGLGGSW